MPTSDAVTVLTEPQVYLVGKQIVQALHDAGYTVRVGERY